MVYKDLALKVVKRFGLALLAVGVVSLFLLPKHSKAATYNMQTGYYVGSGVTGKVISGLGFQPNVVIIKSSTTAGVAVFKSSAMPANATAYMSATADNTASSITFNSDGFSLGTLANVNTANTLYTWTAFSGSDCTSTGNFCVGTYTGDGAATKTISTGFQPGVVITKRSTAVAAIFRTNSMPANQSEFFMSTAADTTGAYIRSFGTTSFDVGTANNASAGVYYYIAFKSGNSMVAEGSYTGNGVDNRNVTGLGFQPDVVYVKNSSSATANNRRAVLSSERHLGDGSSFIGDAVADTTNYIQAMLSDGFQVGSGVGVNENAATTYWFAFGGTPGLPTGSGTFQMDQGTYTGTGVGFALSSLAFAPDLIMIKDNSTGFAVFRTRDMAGDTTAYLANAVADFSGGVTSLNSNGFNIGTSAVVNTSGAVYQWQAFGNAYRADKNSGAADFAIGTFYGNGIDDRNITSMPFQPDLVAMKRNSTTAGTFRTSSMSGDLSSFFNATAESNNVIQSLSSSGFQVGTNAASNAAGSLHRWFAFKAGTNFQVGTYTGDGVDNKAITAPALKPDLAWIKRTTAVAGVQKPSTLIGDITQYFVNTTNAAGRIKSFTNNGFTLGTQTETNASAGSYRYAVWRVPVTGVLSNDVVDAGGISIATPSLSLNTLGYPFDCNQSTGTLGTASQKIRISNMTSNPAWTTSIAATGGAATLWRNGGNTQQFDYNDSGGSPSGCSDGGDTDTKAGQLRVEPAAASLSAQPGCSTSNISLGSNQGFSEGSIDAITLLAGSSSADVECYWDMTNIILRQYVPVGQTPDNYTINLTVTTVSS